MQSAARWIARAGLGLVAGLAVVGAIDPNHDYWITIFPDEAEHAGLAFALLMLALAVLPKCPVWLLATPLVVAGAGLELLQASGLVAGQFEWRDAGANVLGVGGGMFALMCLKLRNRERV